MRNLGLSWAILDILSRTCAFFGSLLLASIMRWWGRRFCELCSLSSYYVFRVETSLRRLHDNSIVEFPNWHVPGANGLGNQTTISQQTHCGEIMCRILILLCVLNTVFQGGHICVYRRGFQSVHMCYPPITGTVRVSMPLRCLLNVDVSQLWPGILVTHRLRHPSVLFSPRPSSLLVIFSKQ